MMEELSLIQRLSVLALPILLAITIHEAAHGWVAMKLGDNTAKMLGRVSINPIRHIDPVGTVILPLVMYATTGFLFGWAKPVPVVMRNLRNPRRDMALVALAGPMSNLFMAIAWAVVLRIGVGLDGEYTWLAQPLQYMGYAGILINAFLMVLNLVPLLPLDGGRILNAFLPSQLSIKFEQTEQWGIFIVLGLLVMGWLGWFVGPGVSWVISLSASLAGLNLA